MQIMQEHQAGLKTQRWGKQLRKCHFFFRTKYGTCSATSVGLCEMLTDVLSEKKKRGRINKGSLL